MTGKLRGILLFCFWFLFAADFPAPSCVATGMPDAAAQGEGTFNIRVDVDLVTIEVVALDKKGKPVPNLKMENFRLYEDGKRQEILSFDEVKGDSAISPLGILPLGERGLHRGKTVLIIFDDSTIPQQYLKKARDSAARFVKEHMRAQDLFAVASFGMSMRILQNLTSDRDEVLAAIEQPAASIPAGTFYFEELLRALEQINYSLARLKGPKSVLIYGRLGYFSCMDVQTVFNRALESAKKCNVVYYTIDPSTTTGDSGSDTFAITAGPAGASTPRGIPVRGGGARAGGMAPATLRSLASGSGGYAIVDTNNIDAELDRLDQQISNYYVLGYQSNNPKRDGSFRKVEVKIDIKGITLKHRSGYQDRRPIDVLASSRHEQKLLAALFSPGTATQLPIVFRPAYFYDSPRSARVLVAAKIQMENVAFKKKGGQLEADLNIMGVAHAEDGSIAARFSETLPITGDKSKEEELHKKDLAYRNYFKLRPGKYRLKLAVSDQSNNLGSAEQSLEIPMPSEQEITCSSLVIAERMSPLPDLIQNLETQMLDQSDPLIFSGMLVEPRVDHKMPVNTPIPVLFRVYHLPDAPDQWDLKAKATLVGEKGELLQLQPFSLNNALSPAGKGEAVVGLNLHFQNLVPGRYQLIIEVTHVGSIKPAIIQTDLEIVG